MNDTTTCPSCRRPLRIAEDLLGREVKCPACSTVFVATLDPPSPPAPAREEPDSEPELELEEEKPRRSGRRDREEAEERPRDVRRRSRFDADEDEEDRPDWRRRDYEPHRGGLVLALGLCAFLFLPIPLGPIAWWLGSTDMARIKAGQMDREGEGLTQAGRILGIISTILGGLGVLFLCLVIGVILAAAATH